MSKRRCGVIAMVLLASAPVAAESVSYTYDAKGRLVRVVRSGVVVTDYTYDKADNRRNVKTTGSTNPAPA